MNVNVGDFIGSWTIKWVAGQKPFLQEEWTLFIGTNTHGDSPPSFTGEYAVVVGFTVMNGQSQVELSTTTQPTQDPPHQPLELMFVGNTLRWTGYYDQQPLHIYISLSASETTGATYLSLYGSTIWGDPDQVAVWGTDARPPGG